MNTLIIAEAGVNHNGSIQLAKQLIDCAVDSGADFVKFQTFKAENMVSKKAAKAEYQKTSSPIAETQYEMLKRLELSKEDLVKLFEYANSRRIGFLSTAFDEESLDFLDNLGVEMHKIPSGEITNLPYLKGIASKRKATIVSTGMATIEEIDSALDVLLQHGLRLEEIIILHCTTEYPAPFAEVNLKAMQEIRKRFGVRVGYSDHTQGIAVPIAAVALGAMCIEKHFTIDRNLPGPDHRASLEPSELKEMVNSIRHVELAMLGNGVKAPTPSELKNRDVARKSIHLKIDLPAGHILAPQDLIMMRPGTGISPMNMFSVVGKRLKSELPAETMLQYEHFL